MICCGVVAAPSACWLKVFGLRVAGQPAVLKLETAIESRFVVSAPSIWLPSGKLFTSTGTAEPPGPGVTALLQVWTKGTPEAAMYATCPLARKPTPVARLPTGIGDGVTPGCTTKSDEFADGAMGASTTKALALLGLKSAETALVICPKPVTLFALWLKTNKVPAVVASPLEVMI